MRKTMIASIALVGLSLFLTLAPVRAQENMGDEDKFSFGKVTAVAPDQITVKEYDFTKDADVDMTYYLTSETEFGNVNAAADLVAGDDIVLDYTEKEGRRVVTTLVKEEKGGEEMPLVEGDAAPAVTEGAPLEEAPAPALDAPAEAPAQY